MWLIKLGLTALAICYGVGWLVQHGYWEHITRLAGAK